jgi:argininosuccinate synthase
VAQGKLRPPIITVTVDTGGIDAAGAKTLAERSKAYGAIAHHQIDARADYFEQVLRFLVMGNVRRGQLYPCAWARSASCRRSRSR